MTDLGFHNTPDPAQRHLVGVRTWLRPPQPDDWAEWSSLRQASREFLTPWEPSWPDDSLTRPAFLRRLDRQRESWRLDLGYDFLVFRASDNALLGGCVLSNLRRGMTQTALLGYWIGQSYSRQGYMFDALQAVLAHAFDTLSLHRLEAGALPSNSASRALLTKLGFREEGLARGYLRINGHWEDHVLFGLLRDEWQHSQRSQKGKV